MRFSNSTIQAEAISMRFQAYSAIPRTLSVVLCGSALLLVFCESAWAQNSSRGRGVVGNRMSLGSTWTRNAPRSYGTNSRGLQSGVTFFAPGGTLTAGTGFVPFQSSATYFYGNPGFAYGVQGYGGFQGNYFGGYPPVIGVYPFDYYSNYGVPYGVTGIVAPPVNLQLFPPTGLTKGASIQQPPVMPQAANPKPVVPKVTTDFLPNDAEPVAVEFAATPVVDKEVSAAIRIQSIRYQSSGDDAFRRGEYASAEVFYRSAAETAPVRRAPWLRLAWSQVAQQRYDEATRNIKRGFLTPDDASSSWIDGMSLYGKTFDVQVPQHSDALWQWLHQRAGSADRLLLVSAFEQLRGYGGTARELLDTAFRNGLSGDIFNAFDATVTDELNTDTTSDPSEKSQTVPSAERPFGNVRVSEFLVPATPAVPVDSDVSAASDGDDTTSEKVPSLLLTIPQ